MTVPHVGRPEKAQGKKTASPTSSTNEEKVLCEMLPIISFGYNTLKSPVIGDLCSASQSV